YAGQKRYGCYYSCLAQQRKQNVIGFSLDFSAINKTGDTFSDMKSFEGPLHAIFDEAYSFIVRNTL
ncbi:MAG: hypothetical protein ACOYLR_12800, partial [Chlorobium sp.]